MINRGEDFNASNPLHTLSVQQLVVRLGALNTCAHHLHQTRLRQRQRWPRAASVSALPCCQPTSRLPPGLPVRRTV